MTIMRLIYLLALVLPATVRAQAVYGNASDNKILAQQLVYDMLAAHCDLLIVGFHGVSPADLAKNASAPGITVAINLDRIGKPDDSDDDAVAIDHKTIMAPNPTDPNKFEIATPLFTAGGVMLNASVNMVFDYQVGREGDDLLGLFTRAYNYRVELAQTVPSWEALFSPVESLNTQACQYSNLQDPEGVNKGCMSIEGLQFVD